MVLLQEFALSVARHLGTAPSWNEILHFCGLLVRSETGNRSRQSTRDIALPSVSRHSGEVGQISVCHGSTRGWTSVVAFQGADGATMGALPNPYSDDLRVSRGKNCNSTCKRSSASQSRWSLFPDLDRFAMCNKCSERSREDSLRDQSFDVVRFRNIIVP